MKIFSWRVGDWWRTHPLTEQYAIDAGFDPQYRLDVYRASASKWCISKLGPYGPDCETPTKDIFFQIGPIHIDIKTPATQQEVETAEGYNIEQAIK
jgi:hypothetical protein